MNDRVVASGSPVVWIVDSQHWPRAYLRAELLERGFEAVGFATLGHAVTALEHPLRGRPGVAVVELRGLGSKAREGLRDLAKRGIPVVLLGGSVEVNRKWVVEMEWAAVIERPVTIGAVADEVERVVRIGGDGKDCQGQAENGGFSP
jgi:FixJ family two-component response regulator